ncbi:hemicentin-2 isoform X8 [Lates calcarifer]|uniref:Hemicentin-2 isoform X8 n=1 Tax=Lates calcarifer TaxID=8187 RepID=A0AAJ8B8I2_LATCA|nr:hemicentin-2 isoform X8 [Lates calcarifer]
MEAVFGLLLMLLRVSHGVETSCDGRQDGAQCYGALGGTVVLQLMDSASEIFRYEWSKNNKTAILQGGKNKKLINQIEKRSSFSDGTFRINSLSRTDSGEYTLQTYDSSGQRSEQRTLQLFIQGVEAYCDGRQDGAQCYGALGGTVVLQLMDSTSEIFRYEWKKNKIITILRGKKNNIVFNVIDDRSFFTPSDGTFRINNLSRTDSGEYTLQTYDSSGQRSEQRTLQLFIQAPVSSVLLVSECLSQGWTRVSCSSEGGDSPQYSWTLDGHTLTDAELLSGNHETNNIILKQDVSGRLVCSVRNHISSVSREENISTCKGVETSCDGRQDGAQCYGALGGTVVLQLMDSTSEIFRYEWSKNNKTAILQGGKNKKLINQIENRSSFSDGTFRINNLSRNDSGEYTLQTYDSSGQRSEQRTLQLFIQGVEAYCDGRQDGAQCYGALGGTVVLQLMDSASEIFKYEWKKNKTTTIFWGKKTIVTNNIANRSLFTPSDGTFRINNLSRTDSGEYTLQTYDSSGQRSEQRTLQLFIQGVETYCDGRQDGAQCYGALGGTVVLQLMDSASEIFRYEWKKNNKTAILQGGKNKKLINQIENRSSFSDGTFRINNLSRNNSGEYTLQTYDSNGKKSEPQTLQLFIQAPVSSVLLVSECLSQGWTRVSCSSEGGDSPQYSWTLDGHTLTDAELLSGNHETNNIILKQDVSGRLVCSVRNHVSSVSREERISCIFINCNLSNGTHISQWVSAATNTLCIEPTAAPTTETSTVGKNNVVAIAGVLLALVILVLVGVAVICSQKKQKNDKPKEETDEQELTYADVRFMQRQGQQVQKRAEVEVEYGQVKFPQRPRQSVERAGDDCLYAQVHKDR